MKVCFNLLVSLVLMLGLTISVYAQDHSKQMQGDDGHKMITKDKMQWSEGPAGLPAGAKLTVLAGDPTKEGPFTIRLMFPANYRISPHWHPTAEHVTVIEGALNMGMGEKLMESSATTLEPGGFALMPAKSVHYAFTKAPTVVQIHGTGPFQITYINKADDPRTKEKMR